jgi:hypothetical protein
VEELFVAAVHALSDARTPATVARYLAASRALTAARKQAA